MTKDPTSTCDHQGLFFFNLHYPIMVYFTFIHFTTHLINFIKSHADLLKLCKSFNYLISIEVTMIRMSIIYWLHMPTLNLWNKVEAYFIAP